MPYVISYNFSFTRLNFFFLCIFRGSISPAMIQYLDLLRHVLDHGKFKADRTGTGTYSVFGGQTRYPLASGFPLVTTKKVHLRSIIYELLWFLSGDSDTR